MTSPDQLAPSERLRLARKRIGKSQAYIAKVFKVSTRGYQYYESGEREIPASKLDLAKEQIGLNPDWIYDGKGEMFLEERGSLIPDDGLSPPDLGGGGPKPRWPSNPTEAEYRLYEQIVEKVIARAAPDQMLSYKQARLVARQSFGIFVQVVHIKDTAAREKEISSIVHFAVPGPEDFD